jgi:hypothetical protein
MLVGETIALGGQSATDAPGRSSKRAARRNSGLEVPPETRPASAGNFRGLAHTGGGTSVFGPCRGRREALGPQYREPFEAGPDKCGQTHAHAGRIINLRSRSA